MSGQYVCPSCNGVVWHSCQPASYWRGRRLPKPPNRQRLKLQLSGGGDTYEATTIDEARTSPFSNLHGGATPPTPEQARAETETPRRWSR